MVVSDSGMGVTPCGGKPVTPEVTPCYPQMAMDGVGRHQAQKKAGTFAVARVTGLGWTALEHDMVPEIGIEPTTYALRMRRSTN